MFAMSLGKFLMDLIFGELDLDLDMKLVVDNIEMTEMAETLDEIG